MVQAKQPSPLLYSLLHDEPRVPAQHQYQEEAIAQSFAW
jgi:hypothetical protein